MQEIMQQAIVTPRGFLTDIETKDEIKAWAIEKMSGERNSSATSMSRAEVMKGIKEEQERRKKEEEERMLLDEPLDIAEMLTRYDLPAMPKASPYATEKMPAQAPAPQEEIEEDEPCVQITASADCYTLALIHDAVERLDSTPTLIVVSVLRWLVDGKILKRWQYYYHGVRIPIVPSDGPCDFDVKVYGSSI